MRDVPNSTFRFLEHHGIEQKTAGKWLGITRYCRPVFSGISSSSSSDVKIIPAKVDSQPRSDLENANRVTPRLSTARIDFW